MADIIGHFQDLLSGLHTFYGFLLNNFVARESGVVDMVMTALQTLKDLQRADINRQLFRSWGEFVKAFTFQLEGKIDSAKHGVASAISSAKDLQIMLAGSGSYLLQPGTSFHLQVIHSAIRLSKRAVEDAFNALKSSGDIDDFLPDNMAEKRYKKLDRCLEKQREAHSLTEVLGQGIMNVTESLKLNSTEDINNNVSNVSPEEMTAATRDIHIDEGMRQALPRYLVALDTLESCLSSYGSVVTGIDTWLSQMESVLSIDVDIDLGILNDQLRYRQQKMAVMEKTSSLMVKFSQNKASVFAVWNKLCGRSMNKVLTQMQDVYSEVSMQLVAPLRSQVREIRTALIRFYLEGLTKLSQFTYFFEDREIKDMLESGARSLDVWRKPTFSKGANTVSKV